MTNEHHNDQAAIEELVERCVNGEDDAWRDLVARYQRLVYSIALEQGLSGPDADEVFQETFAALVRQLPLIQRRSGLTKWLITTTTRLAIRHRTRQRKIPSSQLAADEKEARDSNLDWESIQNLNVALERLGDPCATLLRMLYATADKPHYRSIAAQMNVPVGSIGPTRSRCLVKLMAILKQNQQSDVSGTAGAALDHDTHEMDS